MSEKPAEDDLDIKPGSIIDSSKANYVVIKLLGEGGFGAVYRVHLEGEPEKEYAAKVEKKLKNRKHSKLKMEIAILKLVDSLRSDGSHFTKIIDRGKKANFSFLVMQLVGKSLADLKNVRPNRIFSIGTGLGVATQCLEAVEDLHTQGYIHRDIKPANYACGLGEQKHMVYLLDFGIARKFMKPEGEIKTPREGVGFKGTVRFASLACHRGEDMSMKDDCESWFYLLLDLVVLHGLPWRKLSSKNEVRDNKVCCRKEGTPEFEALYTGLARCRSELAQILTYIDHLTYICIPDYDSIYKKLKEAAYKAGVRMDGPYDWELTDIPNKSADTKSKKATRSACSSNLRK